MSDGSSTCSCRVGAGGRVGVGRHAWRAHVCNATAEQAAGCWCQGRQTTPQLAPDHSSPCRQPPAARTWRQTRGCAASSAMCVTGRQSTISGSDSVLADRLRVRGTGYQGGRRQVWVAATAHGASRCGSAAPDDPAPHSCGCVPARGVAQHPAQQEVEQRGVALLAQPRIIKHGGGAQCRQAPAALLPPRHACGVGAGRVVAAQGVDC